MNNNSMNWGQYNTRHVIKHVTLKFFIKFANTLAVNSSTRSLLYSFNFLDYLFTAKYKKMVFCSYSKKHGLSINFYLSSNIVVSAKV